MRPKKMSHVLTNFLYKGWWESTDSPRGLSHQFIGDFPGPFHNPTPSLNLPPFPHCYWDVLVGDLGKGWDCGRAPENHQ